MELQQQLDEERNKNRGLEDDFKFRMNTFITRETQTKNKIENLERRLNEGTDHDEHMQRMHAIGNLHRRVKGGLDSISNNTQKILQDQEKDLMRAFMAKLQEFSRELEQQRNKRGENTGEAQARHRKAVAELHEAQELRQTFDKKNRQLQAENAKLYDQLRTRDDNQTNLMNELLKVRKETAQWKAKANDHSALGKSGSLAGSQHRLGLESEAHAGRPKSRQVDPMRMQQSQNKQFEREIRYRESVQKLKRTVEAERKAGKALRHRHHDLMQQRTELEVLLQQCLDDVRAEIALHRNREGAKPEAGHSGEPELTPLAAPRGGESDEEHARIIDLLLSQERVVELLVSRTFPTEMSSPSSAVNGALFEDDFSWLQDIIPPAG